MSEISAKIKELYYDPIIGFNKNRVYREAKKLYGTKITHRVVDDIINRQQLPQRFAKPSYSYRRHFLVREPNIQWQMDTLFMNLKVKKIPKGLTWKERAARLAKIIVCVDVFSKRVMIRKVKNNTGVLTTNAVKSMVKEAQILPRTIYVDKGGEFKNKYFEKYCRDNNIRLIFANKLAPQVERMNRQIKELASKYKKAYKSNVGDYLDDITKNINSRVSRTHKKTPNDVEEEWFMDDEEGVEETYNNLREYLGETTDAKDIKIGDYVRVLKFTKSPLEKRFVTQWTKSTYRVLKHSMNGIYTLDKMSPNRYNANYIKKAAGSGKHGGEAPPPKRIKEGGVEWQIALARAAQKDKEGYPAPKPREKSKRVRRKRARLAPNQPVNIKQRFKIGLKIQRKFGGKKFKGKITKYDKTTGYYHILYSDGDEEDMTLNQVRRYRV